MRALRWTSSAQGPSYENSSDHSVQPAIVRSMPRSTFCASGMRNGSPSVAAITRRWREPFSVVNAPEMLSLRSSGSPWMPCS